MEGQYDPLLVAFVIGLPVVVVGLIALGPLENWRERRRARRARH
jgi:hypothetical protein